MSAAKRVAASNLKSAIDSADIGLIREYLHYAVESIDATIVLEESYGNRAPILQTLRVYAADARSLLDRLA